MTALVTTRFRRKRAPAQAVEQLAACLPRQMIKTAVKTLVGISYPTIYTIA